MPLSEHEQRILEQLERDLMSQDPKLATALKAEPGHSDVPDRSRPVSNLEAQLNNLVDRLCSA